jgi:hypothetical protein
MHDVKDLLGSVVEEPAAKSEKGSIDLILRPMFFEFASGVLQNEHCPTITASQGERSSPPSLNQVLPEGHIRAPAAPGFLERDALRQELPKE